MKNFAIAYILSINTHSKISPWGNLIDQNSVSGKGKAVISWAMDFIKHAEHKLLTQSNGKFEAQ